MRLSPFISSAMEDDDDDTKRDLADLISQDQEFVNSSFSHALSIVSGNKVKLIKPDGDLNQKLTFVKLPNAHDSSLDLWDISTVLLPVQPGLASMLCVQGGIERITGENYCKIFSHLPWKNTTEKDHDQRMPFQVKVCDGYDL